MKISIVTPSFNQLSYLKRCVASVRDQVSDGGLKSPAGLVENVETAQRASLNDLNGFNDFNAPVPVAIEHIVIDGGSTDGTVEWLADGITHQPSTSNYQLSFISEADEGMYDALNKGFARATGDIFAWLNCDEQYLPGVLRGVIEEFLSGAGGGILFGGMLMVDPAGRALSCRKAMPMRRLFLEASYLYNFSCSMFFARSVWKTLGGFNAAYRAAGDADFVLRALDAGTETFVSQKIYAAFTSSDVNLSSADLAVGEHRRLQPDDRRWSRGLRIPLNVLRLAEKMLRGGYRMSPLTYALYLDDLLHRTTFENVKTVPWWPGHRKPYLHKHRNDPL